MCRTSETGSILRPLPQASWIDARHSYLIFGDPSSRAICRKVMKGRQILCPGNFSVSKGLMTRLCELNPGRQTKSCFFLVMVKVDSPSIEARWPPPESLLITAFVCSRWRISSRSERKDFTGRGLNALVI